jgi:hypothetical protein
MKKLILLTLITMTLLTFIGCNTNNEARNNASVDTSTNDIKLNNVSVDTSTNDIKLNEVDSSEIVSTEISETTEVDTPKKTSTQLKAKDIIFSNDSVVFELHNTYYNESGGIVVEGLIVNVTDHMAGSMILKKLKLFNENDELIASNSFGYIQEYGACYVGEELEISFIFLPVDVYIKDDDLDSVESVSRFTSEH